MVRRIKAGKAASIENPSYQDLVTALQEGPRAALKIYRTFTAQQYQAIKGMMDAFEILLPDKIVIAWKAIEAVHDWRQEQ